MEGNTDGASERRQPTKEGIPRRKSQRDNTRHRREVSVDMLNNDSGSSADHATLSVVPESRTASLLDAAYQTPGTSTSESSSREQDGLGFSPDSRTASPEIPSIDEQISKIKPLVITPYMEGQKGYIVSNKWLARVLSRSSDVDEAKKYPKEAAEGPIGGVDNTDLNLVVDPTLKDIKDEKGEPYIPLRRELAQDDWTIFPQEAWDLVIKWYGLLPGSLPITRYCHSTSDVEENLQFELHPPIFTILKLPDQSGGLSHSLLKDKNSGPAKTLASKHEVFQTFLKRAKKLANIDIKVKVRVWKLHGGLRGTALDSMMTPEPSRANSPAPGTIPVVDPGQNLVIDVNTFAKLDFGTLRELVDVKDETGNEKYNGRASVDLVGFRQDEVIVLEEQTGGPAGGEWVSDGISNKVNDTPVSVSSSGPTIINGTLKPRNDATSGRTSPAPSTGMMTRGRTQKNGKTRGTVGLVNLGNTCYMNSALQCLRSVQELTPYFLNGKYKQELNYKNPLGFKGVLAKAYAALLGELYGVSGKSAFTPREFKNLVNRSATTFSGYGQQDSQEFLGWLLSGLEEDLNRIQNKPYIEKPDSTDEMVHNPVALRGLADKCWDIYKARNDSVISELFAGVYKSTVACPECSKVSIIFDPFTTFTLQLPIENTWYHDIYYFPLHSKPVLMSVDVDKNATLMVVKQLLAKRYGGDPRRMIACEIYKNKYFKVFDDTTSINEERITDNDTVVVYELEDMPTNWPPPTKKTGKKAITFHRYSHDDEESLDDDPAVSEKMLVAVYHRHPKASAYKSDAKGLFATPFFIMVNPTEGNDYEAILRKVLVNVQSMTTRDILDSSGETEAEDSDTVLMSTEDTDSTEPKVQAQSVDSEDGMVDISMRDANEDTQETSHKSSEPPLRKTPPPILSADAPIKQELQTLFDMQIFSAGSGTTIPTGFNVLSDESKSLPSMADRRPKQKPSARDQVTKRLTRLSSASSSDEDAEIDAPPPLASDVASDSDDDLPPVKQLVQSNNTGQSRSNTKMRLKRGKLMTYSRKDKRSHLNESSEPQNTTGPLIRLGEAIMLDWDPNSYDALFGGISNGGDDRGVEIIDTLRAPQDLELQARKLKREKRRRNGVSLEDCLDELVKPEILSENDAWYCPNCKTHRRATKTFELWKSPDILVIHLKRFSTGQSRYGRDKLDVFVDFPVDGLDLTPRVATQEENKSAIYDLFAVDNHYGSMGGGHYTAFAKNHHDDRWYEYNDSMAFPIDPRKVVTSAAYLLFYRRRSDKPLGGPFFEQLLDSDGDNTAGSRPGSRATSPSGEDRRLGVSSRNGSSSAFPEAGAVHQAGGGGPTEVAQRTGVDDELPAYRALGSPEQGATLETIEAAETEDEGIDMGEPEILSGNGMFYKEPNWSFDKLPDQENDRPQHTVYYDDSIGGDNDTDVWANTYVPSRRMSDSSTAVMASPASSRHDDDEENPQIHFLDASDEYDPGTTRGFMGAGVAPIGHHDPHPELMSEDDTAATPLEDVDIKMD